MFAPADSSVDAVTGWLAASEIDPSRTSLSKGRNWINFNATISEVESLLRTEYKIYSYVATGHTHVACDEYSIPEDLSAHIDLIMPTVHFDIRVPSSPSMDKRAVPASTRPGRPGDGFLPKKGPIISGPSPDVAPQPFALTTCNTQITPECLRALYNFPNGTLAKS